MALSDEIALAIELHSVEGIRTCFEKGLNPNAVFEGHRLFDFLTSMYTRSPRFRECVKVFVDYGLEFENKALLAVLLEDVDYLQSLLKSQPDLASQKVTLRSAYTPLLEASLLHVCAEFNHIRCAKCLIGHGVEVNIRAGVDGNGFGGHTPIFHTVNQNSNQSKEMMEVLLECGADLTCTVKGLIWGQKMPWETFLPAVNPLSYAMFGRLPQMHRSEETVAGIVEVLLKYAYGISYSVPNIPNKYLAQ